MTNSTRTVSFGVVQEWGEAQALPSGWELARVFPARWNAPDALGTQFLFSATNDLNICSEFLFSGFFKMYVVATRLSYSGPAPQLIFQDGFESGDACAWSSVEPPGPC